MLEEERDFLLREKNALVDRLGGLEERQRSLQELDRQSDNRGDLCGKTHRENIQYDVSLRRTAHRV